VSSAFHLYELARQLRAHATVAFVILLLGTKSHGIEPSLDLFITRSDTYGAELAGRIGGDLREAWRHRLASASARLAMRDAETECLRHLNVDDNSNFVICRTVRSTGLALLILALLIM